MKQKLFLGGFVLALAGIAVFLLTQPYLFVETDTGELLTLKAKPQETFTIEFIHSVQKTPVKENFVIHTSTEKIDLVSTEYSSFGVGLPFLAEDGTFEVHGNKFILSNMNRSFTKLEFRIWPLAEYKLFYHSQIYPIYEMVPSGALVRLRIGPYYSRWF